MNYYISSYDKMNKLINYVYPSLNYNINKYNIRQIYNDISDKINEAKTIHNNKSLIVKYRTIRCIIKTPVKNK